MNDTVTELSTSSRAPMPVPGLPGGVRLTPDAIEAGYECLMDDIGCALPAADAWQLVVYVAQRLERDEVQGAIDTMTMGCDLTGAYRVIAVMSTHAEHG
jgi:hypothetical protein